VINVPLAGGFQAQLRVPVDPDTLRLVARASGGRTFSSPDSAQLRVVYQHLGSRLGSRKESREVTDLFAGGSAAFLIAGGALSALWFRRLP
jgi:Ca-activated chloride channel homolog